MTTIKKILFVLISLFIIVAIALFFYFYVQKGEGTKEVTDNQDNLPSPSGKNAGIVDGETGKQEKIVFISNEKVISPTIKDGKINFFSQTNGELFEINLDGSNLQKIPATSLTDLIKIIWSPDNDKVVGIFKENEQIKKYFFDYKNNKSISLSQNLRWVTWSPDSNKIAYQYIDEIKGINVISVSEPDGSNWKNIFNTRIEDLIINWPLEDKISIHPKPSGHAPGMIALINPITEFYEIVLSNIFGLSINWSSKGDKFIYSNTDSDGKNLKLYLWNEKNKTSKELDFITLPEKCTFDQDGLNIFCAIPQKISLNAVWPDDYYMGIISTKDDLYKINLETNEKIKIIASGDDQYYDAKELMISPNQDYLIFINKRDGKLYSVRF